MAVLEDFESIADWSIGTDDGTDTIQSGVAVVGNALQLTANAGALISRYKEFIGLTSFGIYVRTKHDGGRCKVDLVDWGILGIVTVYLGNGSNNFFYTVKAGQTDVGIAPTADTWYWIGIEKVDATHCNIYCYNEAKTVEIWKAENKEINNWVANPEIVLDTYDSETNYYDELTDDGSAPTPAAGATMNMKGYW